MEQCSCPRQKQAHERDTERKSLPMSVCAPISKKQWPKNGPMEAGPGKHFVFPVFRGVRCSIATEQ